MGDVTRLQETMGYTFMEVSLLERGLSHASWAHEHAVQSNERLEFLGDAVLQLVTTQHLYGAFTDADEGVLSRIRTRIVRRETVAEWAATLGVDQALRLGVGEELGGGRGRQKLLCDAMEAVIGAVYLDGGLEAARRVLSRLISPLIAQAALDLDSFGKSPRSVLQEWTQTHQGGVPDYHEQASTGSAHAPVFHVEVHVDGKLAGRGEGASKAEARTAAAAAALERLRGDS